MRPMNVVEWQRAARLLESQVEHERDELLAALREIARGKSPDDIGCLSDEWMLMAGRLVGIARAAIAKAEGRKS